ncbi:KpsF/GutQ family sugar-phosphate isomerase [Niallia sp.]|uniref:KpsF/GutQ family sugar-phosphate isomerase n=1 Tax=Niallia sp. TaxID=2837523 RepID=UPI0028A0F712|nr:KpsF/GutQ family sugar-phosphate isomerase [Niallia sp.]
MQEINLPKFDYTDTLATVLEKEAKAILDLRDMLDESIEDAIHLILSCKGKVVVTGIGKSGIIARKIQATFSSTGTPSCFLHPSEGLHGDLGMVTSDDIVLAISNSGESEEVLRLLPSIETIGAKLIAITKNIFSALAMKADVTLCLGEFEEACPLGLAPTTSTTVTLALGDAIAIALLEVRKFRPEDFALYHPNGSLGRKLLLKVDDIIFHTRKNPIVHEGDKVKDALFEMTDQGLGAASIVNEKEQLIGVLTDGDIRRAFALSMDVMNENVENLISAPSIVIEKGALAAEALQLMEEKEITVLPIVDTNNKPVGMLHLHDLMKLGI